MQKSYTYLYVHISMNFWQRSFWQATAKVQTITVLRNNMFKYTFFVQLPESHVSECGFSLCQIMKSGKEKKKSQFRLFTWAIYSE